MPNKRVVSQTVSFSSPVGGWNSRDPLPDMDPNDAVSMVNFVPYPTDVRQRLGWVLQNNITGQAQTLATYSAQDGTEKLFAFSNNTITDVSTAGSPVVQPITTTNSQFQTAMVSTTGGTFLLCVNGADPMLIYNGSYWFKTGAANATPQTISGATLSGSVLTVTTAAPHGLISNNQILSTGFVPDVYNRNWLVTVTGASTFTITVPAASPAVTTVGTYSITQITGIDSSKFANINLFKNRVWFAENNSLRAWYLGVQSITGAASMFDLGGFCSKGGYLQASGTWSIDSGQGLDDRLVHVTSAGQILVYQGTDPTNAMTWSLIGVFDVGTVFTRKCFHKWAGDLLLLTHDGLLPLAQALQSTRLDPRIALTDKIYYPISDAADNYADNYGWQIIYYARANILIINVPFSGAPQQFVMHTFSKAWCSFQDISAYSFTIFQDEMYFGGDGVVGNFFKGNSDNGNNINCSVQQAFSYFGAQGRLKRFMLARPTFLTDQLVPGTAIGVNVDYNLNNTLQPASFNPSLINIAKWDDPSTLWDGGKVWASGELTVSRQWQGVSGIGTAAGFAMNLSSQNANIRWTSTDLVFEPGGVL